MDGLLGKELPDWKEVFDTALHHQRLEWTTDGGNSKSGDGDVVRTVPPMEERLTLTSTTSLPPHTLEQSSTGAPKSDDSGVLEAGEDQGAGEAGDKAEEENDTMTETDDGDQPIDSGNLDLRD